VLALCIIGPVDNGSVRLNAIDVLPFKRLLGHTTLAMTERYLAIAQADIHIAHRQASPVANWLL
jgi:hypothetical protein